jgi:hypothetical protein
VSSLRPEQTNYFKVVQFVKLTSVVHLPSLQDAIFSQLAGKKSCNGLHIALDSCIRI